MDQSTGTPNNGTSRFDLFEVWKEYETVAMHFNDLLIRVRTQSLAAVAAFATIAGVLLKGETISRELRWGTLLAVSTILSIFWLAIWILDFTYYNRLLLGAVKALVAIEDASKKGIRISEIVLSTEIEAAVKKADPFFSRVYWSKAKGRWLFYTLVFIVLISGVIISIYALGGIAGLRNLINQPAN